MLYLDQSRCFLYKPYIFSFFSLFLSFINFSFHHFVIFLQSFHSLIDSFYLILRSFWYTPWADFQGINNHCSGWFWKKYYFFGSKRVQGIYIYIYILDKETWSCIISNHVCFIFKRLTLKQHSMTSNTGHHFLFLLYFVLSSLLLRPPSV